MIGSYNINLFDEKGKVAIRKSRCSPYLRSSEEKKENSNGGLKTNYRYRWKSGKYRIPPTYTVPSSYTNKRELYEWGR